MTLDVAEYNRLFRQITDNREVCLNVLQEALALQGIKALIDGDTAAAETIAGHAALIERQLDPGAQEH